MRVSAEAIGRLSSDPRFRSWGGKPAARETKSKYHAQKCTLYGIEFDSKREAMRYPVLLGMVRSGAISDLRRQVPFELIPAQDGERSVVYIADFVYKKGGETVVEDTKGYRTKDYIIKRKLMLRVHGIRIQEV